MSPTHGLSLRRGLRSSVVSLGSQWALNRLLVPRRWSKIYFVLWWLVSSVIWINLFLALILEVQGASLGGLGGPGLRAAPLMLGGSGNSSDI